MKNFSVFVFIFCVQWAGVYAQPATGALLNTRYYGSYYSFKSVLPPLTPNETATANYYLNKSWNTSLISISDQEKMELKYPAKYNLLDNQIEILTPDGIRALSAEMISTLKWTDSISGSNGYFVSGKIFLRQGNPILELMEILEDGTQPLLKRKFATVAQVDKSIASAKPLTDDVVVRTEYYIVENKNLFKVKKEKDLLDHLEKNKEGVKAFIEKEKLSVKKEDDLIRVMHYYNSNTN